MDKSTTEYDKRLSEYKERMMKRNIELTSDDDDELDRLLDRAEPSSAGRQNTSGHDFVRRPAPTPSVRREQTDGETSARKQAGIDNPLKNQPVRNVRQEEYGKRKTVQPVKKRYEEYEEYEEYEDEDETVATRFTSLLQDIREGAGNLIRKIRSGRIGPLSSTGKWFVALCIVLVIFVCVTIAYLVQNAKYKYNQMDIHEISKEDLVINEGVSEATKGYRTMVLYGVDSRESNLAQGTNSDCIIIVSINNSTKDVRLVSVYRDTLFKIQNDSKIMHKVNYAYQSGGPLVSINTLNANLDLEITDYIAVDFNAMADIIDALGGVEVSIEEDEINNLNQNLAEQIGISGKYSDGIYEAGVQTLMGQQAVAYSRIRSTALGDITRTERQREVLLGLVDKLLDADTKTVSHLLDISFESVSTSFTRQSVENLLKDAGDYQITESTGFPFAYDPLTMDEQGSVLVAADMSTNVAALHAYLYGDTAYSPSEAVVAISDEIKTETGVQAKNIENANHDGPNGNTSGQMQEGVTTLTEPPAGMIVDE